MKKYKIIRSDRKTVGIHIDENLNIIVRAPKRCPDELIEEFVSRNEEWIDRTTEKIRKAKENEKNNPLLSQPDVLLKLAREYLPKRTEYWSEITGIEYSYVKITSARKRFGSCNSEKGICYSLYLMAYPPEAVDYVIVHELAHTVYMNHGRDFYSLIEKYLPDYREREKMLKNKENRNA